MPWRGEKNPYKIWLSEVILQQTRVEQGLPYYIKFIHAFPDVFALANAPINDVLKLWEGLGYYSRAKNLHFAAKQIVHECNGKFPENREDILKLKGVGKYTASAIASFAFGGQYAVIDGNVKRIMARYFGINKAIDSSSGEKEIEHHVNLCLSDFNSAAFNQAMMDFGAMICKPKAALCNACTLNDFCEALHQNKVEELPFKHKKVQKITRYFFYFIAIEQNKVWMKKRLENDIWQGLYDFPLLETEKQIDENQLLNIGEELLQCEYSILEKYSLKQVLTHQNINAVFLIIKPKKKLHLEFCDKIKIEDLMKYPKPKIVNELITRNKIF